MRIMLGLCSMLIASPSVAQVSSPCLDLIYDLRDASDCQNTELYREITWFDGYSISVDGDRRDFADTQLNGPCPKYRTYLREIRMSSKSTDRATLRLKSITLKVAFDDRYSGDYTVAKMEYVCERREGRWAILSQRWLSRNDLINEQAAAEFHRNSGYEGNSEADQ